MLWDSHANQNIQIVLDKNAPNSYGNNILHIGTGFKMAVLEKILKCAIFYKKLGC